ncbi:MAG: endonuclease/exonuclease/phosphatase family protein [Caldilineaceae bacterium]|nr:endonuclease/exonuclease/phosphatase family protein [Caldilineaceae bacterium]
MTKFLFWNVARRNLSYIVANLATQHNIDVILLAEFTADPSEMLWRLNQLTSRPFDYAVSIGCEKIHVFTRFSRRFCPPVYETERLTVRHLRLPGLTDILVAAIHFPSKLNWNESSQVAESVKLATDIHHAEKKIGHTRTIVVGDLNMNPFEAGMVNANGLHGVMTRAIAQKGSRVVQGERYTFFYNPMWNLMGSLPPDMPGTYYRASSEHNVYFWNTFDQVLVRPSLLAHFDERQLEILHRDGDMLFLSKGGIPSKRIASDHLPIIFQLEL